MRRSYLDEPVPILALATPPGESALAVLRGTGPGSLELVASCFSRPEALRSAPGHALVHGELVDPATGESVDEVLLSVFRAPRSATGEDGVEISCHGSPAVVRRALALLESAGFSPALPGEFSLRAFLHGKTDLVRAEAVQELVRARSEGARAEALRRLEGGLSRRISAARAHLIELIADLQARLDFGEDEPEARGDFDSPQLRALRDEVSALLGSYAAGRLQREGARVVVAGRPNAGKSSLFNLLLREERAIVGPEPGTTRDWIEAPIEVDGIYLRLIDTAGIREAADGVEAEGVSRSRQLTSQAEVVLYVVDGVVGLRSEDEAFIAQRSDAVLVWNKTDIPSCAAAPNGCVPMSAVEGRGLPDLVATIKGRLSDGFGLESAAATAPKEGSVHVASERQKLLLEEALAALDSCLAALGADAPLDAAAVDLAAAANALGEMTGEIAPEELIEAVFSRFCVGK